MRVARIVCVLFSSAAFALQPTTAPFTLGLWEFTSTSTMKATGKMADAMSHSGQAMGTPTTQTMKLCMAGETWQKALSGMGARADACTRSNVVATGQKYSLTLSCNHGSSTISVDSATFFDSPVQMHGTIHLVSNSANGQMVTDGTSTAKFLSSDCGDVKPLGSAIH